MLKQLMTWLTSRMWGEKMVIVSEDKTIQVTRGDTVVFTVSADIDGERVNFNPGDVVRFKVYEKKNANNVVLQKDFPIEAECEYVTITLTGAETKIGVVISKPVDYWYEVELNPFTEPQTIIGYDDHGAKVFKLFPEGRDLVEEEPKEEDIPIVDAELDMTSTRPVQNQAIARAITKLNAEKVSASDIADDLVTDDSKKALSARQGVVLLDKIEESEVGVLTGGVNIAEYTYTKCYKKGRLVVFQFSMSIANGLEGGTTVFSSLPVPEHMVHFAGYSGYDAYRFYVAEDGEVVLLTDVDSADVADIQGIVTYVAAEE